MLLACLNEVEFAAENLSAQGAEQLTGRHSITSFFLQSAQVRPYFTACGRARRNSALEQLAEISWADAWRQPKRKNTRGLQPPQSAG